MAHPTSEHYRPLKHRPAFKARHPLSERVACARARPGLHRVEDLKGLTGDLWVEAQESKNVLFYTFFYIFTYIFTHTYNTHIFEFYVLYNAHI